MSDEKKRRPIRSRWEKNWRALAERQRADMPPMPDPEKESAAFAAWMRENAMNLDQIYKRWPEAEEMYRRRLRIAQARASTAGETAPTIAAEKIYNLVVERVQGPRPKWTELCRWLLSEHRERVTPNQLRMIVRSRVRTTPK